MRFLPGSFMKRWHSEAERNRYELGQDATGGKKSPNGNKVGNDATIVPGVRLPHASLSLRDFLASRFLFCERCE